MAITAFILRKIPSPELNDIVDEISAHYFGFIILTRYIITFHCPVYSDNLQVIFFFIRGI